MNHQPTCLSDHDVDHNPNWLIIIPWSQRSDFSLQCKSQSLASHMATLQPHCFYDPVGKKTQPAAQCEHENRCPTTKALHRHSMAFISQSLENIMTVETNPDFTQIGRLSLGWSHTALCISFLASIQNVQGVHTQPPIYPDRTSLECVPIFFARASQRNALHFVILLAVFGYISGG